MRLFYMKSKDPYDRTKMVDTIIPNLSLRNIMDTVENIEDISKKIIKYKLSESATQTENNSHAKNNLKTVFTLKNDFK